MILVDANILLYAEDSLSPQHTRARSWWDGYLSGTTPVCLCWLVINAFIRIGTNPRVFEHPLSLDQAISRVQSWIGQPCTRLIHPTERHWVVFQEMLTAALKIDVNQALDQRLANIVLQRRARWLLARIDELFADKPQWARPSRDTFSSHEDIANETSTDIRQ